MASIKTLYKYLALLILSIALNCCSAEKNTSASRFYQGMTARYNIYFNGYESYKAGLARISSSYLDDYSSLLKVFESSDPSTVSICASDMERAIQKASKLISLKSITAKPEIGKSSEISPKDKELLSMKEYNQWVDDSYLLIGKARFFKHEYNEATSVFNYCITDANDPYIKAEAAIWLARIGNETGNFSESLRLLNGLDISSDPAKSLRSLYYPTMADLLIKQKKYAEGIEPLEKSIGFASGKRAKYRLTYLLAQLYEKTGDVSHAAAHYRDVIKLHPPYDVEFNARINIAGVFDINSDNPEELTRELQRMLRDSKNKDFRDQIYFALGNIAMKKGDDNEAIKYFGQSTKASTFNLNQKGRSYLALASHYFEKGEYREAGVFYDSATFYLDQNYPDYLTIQTRSLDLGTLTAELDIIQREDSLQKVAVMPETERNNLISTIIAQVTKDESEGKMTDNNDRYNMGEYYENERRFRDNIDQEGKWYFYNQTALTFGRTEFKKRWGNRKLEDNWRRANRSRINFIPASNETAQNTTDSASVVKDNKKHEYYLKNLPLNDSLLTISNYRIANAMLNAGKIYAERIHDIKKATITLEELNSRFPSNDQVPESLYALYTINKESNKQKSETCRQLLIQKYPQSEFARILSDPGYFDKKLAEVKLAEKTYDDAYAAYLGERFTDVISISDEALARFPQNQLAAKFYLLRAYSSGRLKDERIFKDELSDVIKKYPGTPESNKASELIAYLNQKRPELKIEEDKKVSAELYSSDTTSKFVFGLVINDPAFNLNQASFDVISYNIDNYTNKNFKTEGVMVDKRYLQIFVSGFSNYTQAMNYYNSFKPEKSIRNPGGAKLLTFIISTDNLNAFNTDKNPDRYMVFFRDKFK